MIGSIYSTKLELRDSAIHGSGIFAKAPIKKGEILFVKNGHILRNEEKYSHSVIDCYWPIDDGHVLGAQTDVECDTVKLFINHSCDPNCGLKGINTGIAMRNISSGEEITFDYSTLDNEDYSFKCCCGSSQCRGVVTGYDWKKPEIQKKYRGFFVDYLQEKIDSLNGNPSV